MSRLILVLGAHRSGTSLLALSLPVLGVELGERLQGAAKDNPRGFGEDVDFQAINDSALKAVGAAWDTLGPLDLAKAEPRAAVRKILEDRIAKYPIFGLKDPRLCRLLPFWKPLFAEANLDVSCVIALRHPTEAMLSLNTRNFFSEAKGYSLWLVNMISAMTEMDPSWPRVVVDYDLMLSEPEEQVKRIGAALDLDYEAAKFAMFKERIWDPSLRHEQRTVGTTAHDLVSRTYELLYGLARDKLSDLDTRGNFLALQHDLGNMKVMLEGIDKAEKYNIISQQKAKEEGMFKWPM